MKYCNFFSSGRIKTNKNTFVSFVFASARSKNEERAGGGPKPGIPVDLAPGRKDGWAAGGAGGAGGGGEGGPARKRGKANTKGALELVQHSTASMGK